MTEKIAILTSDDNNLKKCLEKFFAILKRDIDFIVADNVENLEEGLKLIILDEFYAELPQKIYEHNNVIRIHPSLLPAFDGDNAIQKTFISGVKVGGVTVHKMPYEENNLKILAQYPILIGHDEHFDEFKLKIDELKSILVPYVVKSILDDTVFDWTELLNSGGCKSGCGGCGKCNQK